MRYCPHCNEEIYDDSIRCLSCGNDVAQQKFICSVCGAKKASGRKFVIFGNTEYCQICAIQMASAIPVTTTHTIEGAKILRYIEVESVEIILGTGLWSETQADIANFFGARATALEAKLRKSKADGMLKLKLIALSKGANAIIGTNLTYTQFSSNMTGVVLSGTLVEITW